MIAAKPGPVGSTESAAVFYVRPKEKGGRARIQSVVIDNAWAINNIGVSYEQASGGGPYLVRPEVMTPISQDTFVIAQGDALVAMTVGWGSQAPGYPENEIITLQFETKQGTKSPVYGGKSGSAKVKEATVRAPDGQEIIGFFGAHGGGQNLILQLDAHFQPEPGWRSLASTIGARCPYRRSIDEMRRGSLVSRARSCQRA